MSHLRDQMKPLEVKVLILFKLQWLTASIAGMKIFELVSSLSGLEANSRPEATSKHRRICAALTVKNQRRTLMQVVKSFKVTAALNGGALLSYR